MGMMVTKKQSSVHLVWFKRDLRLSDHKPLLAAARTGLPVLPLYVVEPDYWAQPFASRRQWAFIRDCLHELRDHTARCGQPLCIRTGSVTDVLSQLAERYEILAIHAHQETGNSWTYARDKQVADWCRSRHIALCDYPFNGIVRGLSSRDKWSAVRARRMADDVLSPPSSLSPVQGLDPGQIPPKSDPFADSDAVVRCGGQ